ncbi:MAG: type II restriction endonuclease, partial [Dyadobacter sp.]
MIKFLPQTPKQALNKAFLKQRPLRKDIDLFKENLIRLLGKVDEIEREENQKNHIRDFLRDTFYKENNEINTKDTKDLVIHLGKTNKEKVGVIIEAKRPSNKGEMPAVMILDGKLTITKINSKALHELILYYFDERTNAGNHELKQLVITNVYEWYIIDANYFDK